MVEKTDFKYEKYERHNKGRAVSRHAPHMYILAMRYFTSQQILFGAIKARHENLFCCNADLPELAQRG